MARRRRVTISAKITVVLRRIPAGRNDPPAPRREPPYVPLPEQQPRIVESTLTPPRLLPLPPRATQPNPRFLPKVEAISRSYSRYGGRPRHRRGHKNISAHSMEGWRRMFQPGAGAHDPRYKDVRRKGGIRPASATYELFEDYDMDVVYPECLKDLLAMVA